jgi:cytochrome c oxidase subunit 2
MRRISSLFVTIGLASAVLTSSPSHADPVHEVEVVAKKFAFEPSVIRVTEGESVRLVIRSADAVHGFAIRDLKIDVQIPHGGTPVTVEFTAPPAGRYEVACSEFCGSGHGQMKAALVSVGPTQTRRRTTRG